MNNSHKRGLWIALLGPDGVGKSAVIEHLHRRLQPGFDGVTHFHFRPRFRRCGQSLPPTTQPHDQTPRGTSLSVAKLVYWLIDYWWAYFVTIRPRQRKHGLIVFDRYCPDILVDPVRYRLPPQVMQFAQWMSRLAPRPDLYVLLDAPAEVVRHRKSELPLPELRRQRVAYLSLFQKLPCRLIASADSDVDEVARYVSAAIYGAETFSLLPACESPNAAR